MTKSAIVRRGMFEEIFGVKLPSPSVLEEDSAGTIAISQDLRKHSRRMRHEYQKVSFLIEAARLGIIAMMKVGSKQQTANFFTKPEGPTQHWKSTERAMGEHEAITEAKNRATPAPRKQRTSYATAMSATCALDEKEESEAALLSNPNELLSKIEAFDIDIYNSCPPVQSFDEAVLFSSDIQSFQDEDYDEEFQRHESTKFSTAFNRNITEFAVQNLEEQEAREQEVKDTRESLVAALNGMVQKETERLERELAENSPTKRQRVEEGLVVAEQEGIELPIAKKEAW